MITDALLGLVGWLAGLFGSLLPDDHLPLPAADAGLLGWLARLDSLLPVGPVVQLAVGVLASLAAFLVLRLVLVLWNLAWP